MGSKQRTIGERIEKVREFRGLSREELGEAIGKDGALIYRYETGCVSKMRNEVLEKISVKLEAPLSYLMGDSNEFENNFRKEDKSGNRVKLIEKTIHLISELTDDEIQILDEALDILVEKKTEKKDVSERWERRF